MVNVEKQKLLRYLPKIDDLLSLELVKQKKAPRKIVVEAIRNVIESYRNAILCGDMTDVIVNAHDIVNEIDKILQPSLRKTINATGVILHTNLGRAPLPPQSIESVSEISLGYGNLEYDLEKGQRGSRHDHIASLLCAITDAEDAVVVNNNAAAVLLGLAALGRQKDVIISRGELIEIGGSFRIPEVMAISRANLVEVGTTNKTHLKDYSAAISTDTSLLLKVHRSNFSIEGFTSDVDVSDLVELSKGHAIDVMVDLGSGMLLSQEALKKAKLPIELDVSSCIQTGASLVTFSGDKLLGGPQAGILVGTKACIEKVRSHSLMRALRPDKMTLAALYAVLSLYHQGKEREIPTVSMLLIDKDSLHVKAQKLYQHIINNGHVPEFVSIDIIECISKVGGGAMPQASMSSWGIAIRFAKTSAINISSLEKNMRTSQTSVIARIADDALILDVRTIFEDEFDCVCDALANAWS